MSRPSDRRRALAVLVEPARPEPAFTGGGPQKTGGSPRCERGSAASTIVEQATSRAAARLKREGTCTDEEPHSDKGISRRAAGGFGGGHCRRRGRRSWDCGRFGNCCVHGRVGQGLPGEEGQVRAPEAQARRADDHGHHGERQDRASPEGRKPGILQVDVGDNGSADFSFKRKQVARIAVDARAGDDLVRMDESNGVFTNRIPTTIAGGAGNDTLARRLRSGDAARRRRQRHARRQRRQRPGAAGRR